MFLTCIVKAYPPPTAKIIKLSEDWENSVDILETDLVSNSKLYLNIESFL